MPRTQTLVQLTDQLLSLLDQEAASTGKSRSEIIREAIGHYFRQVISDEIDRALVDGYSRHPQQTDAWAEVGALQAIAEEPW